MDKFLRNFTCCLLAVSLLSCIDSNKEYLPETFEKLEGTWQLENSNTFEIWENYDSLYIGQVVKIQGEDTIIQEHLRILKIDNEVFYEATVPGQNNGLPVRFKLIEFEKNEFVFANNKHDFPKKIIYNLQYDKTLQATISGKDKTISYKYYKIENLN